MARTYPAKRSRVATDEDVWAEDRVTAVQHDVPCIVCREPIEEGQRIVDGDPADAPFSHLYVHPGALVHARCADAGEALP